MLVIVNGIAIAQNHLTPTRPDIIYNHESNYLSYAGDINDEIWSFLSETEKSLYDSCLSECGLTRENVKWYSKELFDTLATDDFYCSVKVISLNTEKNMSFTVVQKGKNRLNTPECLFVVTRVGNKFDEVAIHMYY
jgi:hypothetical protein